MSRRMSHVLPWHLVLVAVLALPVWAQEPREQAGTLAHRSRNPFADSINLPATLSLGFGVGPRRETEPTLNFEPRIPLGGTDEWRFLTRSNVSILHVHDPDETTGLGDIDVSLFLMPEHTTTWVWGVGPIVRFPTATDRSLGSGKWSAGPTAGLVYVPGPWINGIVASHLWSFAGPRSREDVSQTQAELRVSYTFRNDWYMQTAPTLSYDWRAPRTGMDHSRRSRHRAIVQDRRTRASACRSARITTSRSRRAPRSGRSTRRSRGFTDRPAVPPDQSTRGWPTRTTHRLPPSKRATIVPSLMTGVVVTTPGTHRATDGAPLARAG